MTMRNVLYLGLASAALLFAASCSQPQQAAATSTTFGENPTLVEPVPQTVPTTKTATPVGWAEGAAPTVAQGFTVNRFAEGMTHPRWMYILPNGDMLVSQSATRASAGLSNIAANIVMKSVGAIAPSPNDIVLLRDTNGDGVADKSSVFIAGLNQPFGMALIGNAIYVANTNSVMRFPYKEGDMEIKAPGEKVTDLPFKEGANGHWTRNLLAKSDGSKLYVTVGSSSNIGDKGMEAEEGRAAIYEMNPDGSGRRIFASGLRNPNGLAWEPKTGALWTTVNERDLLGDNLVPDYMTSVKDGGFYGWPYSYYGDHVDNRVQPQKPDMVAKATKPDYALGAHTGTLGLAFYNGSTFPAHYQGGAFIGQHGSWNRSGPAGYRVIFVPFANGKPSGPPEEILTGFLNAKGEAQGRPVGVAVDKAGALYVADDVGNVIWRVTPKG
jgi:glucose/arabinose dehydrogenase